MASVKRTSKTFGLLLGAALLAWILYPQPSRPELTIATVNNADMILMQQLSREFEKQNRRQVELGGSGRERPAAATDHRYFHRQQHL